MQASLHDAFLDERNKALSKALIVCVMFGRGLSCTSTTNVKIQQLCEANIIFNHSPK